MAETPREPYRAEAPLVDLIPPDRRRRNAVLLVLSSMVIGAVTLGIGQQLWAMYQLSSVEQSVPVTTPLVRSLALRQAPNLHLDRASRRDGPIAADGSDDEAFDVIADGPFVSLLLLTTDASGRAMGGQQWDTVVGSRVVPRGTHSSFMAGASTWQLAVYAGDAPRNTPDGALAPLGEGRHELRIYASGSGWFTTGRYFRLYGELADGNIVESGVLAYEGNGAPAAAAVEVAPVTETPDGVKPFDRGAAAAALGAVDLRGCRQPNGPTGSGHVKLTFLPSGKVSSAVVDGGPFPGTPSAKCVSSKFERAVVPPFSGGPVTVGKSFDLSGDPPFTL